MAGQTYAIQVADVGLGSGMLQIRFSVSPSNDDFSTATVVPLPLPQQVLQIQPVGEHRQPAVELSLATKRCHRHASQHRTHETDDAGFES